MQSSEFSEICSVRIPSGPSGQLPFIQRGALIYLLHSLLQCGQAFHIKEDMLSTLCTGIMGIVGLLMIHQTSLPLNKLRKAMLIGLCAAFVVCYFFLPELFTLSALDNPSLLILVVLGLLAFSVMFVCRRGLRKAKARLNKGIFPRRKKR